jgi:hypothetical protein
VNAHALPAALAEARRRMDGPIGTSTRDLARLLGLELWLRLFVGDLEQGQEEKYAEATVTRC